MRNRHLILCSLVLLIAIAGVAIAQVTSPGAAMLVSPARSRPSFVVGPYLQKMTADAVTVMWQSNTPDRARVTIAGPGFERNIRVSKAVEVGEVRVGALQPNTKYSYRVRLSGSLMAAGGRFRTFPTEPRPTKFLVYGDTRTSPERHRTVINAMARQNDVDFVLHTGDLVADGRKTDLWPVELFGPARPMMSRVPFFFEIGNHEQNSDNYFRFLSLPGNERWYSFDLPGVHVIGLDSMFDFDRGSEQYNWLLDDLARHKDVRWKFIFMHEPVYTSGEHGKVDDRGVPRERAMAVARKVLPVLCKRYHVAAVFSGHDHAYERSTRDGVQYVVSGGGGAPSYSDPNAKNNPYRQVFRSMIHYCMVTINRGRARLVAKAPDGAILDQVELR